MMINSIILQFLINNSYCWICIMIFIDWHIEFFTYAEILFSLYLESSQQSNNTHYYFTSFVSDIQQRKIHKIYSGPWRNPRCYRTQLVQKMLYGNFDLIDVPHFGATIRVNLLSLEQFIEMQCWLMTRALAEESVDRSSF